MRKPGTLLIICTLIFAAAQLHAEDQFFNSNSVRIRYVVRGKGEPVILVHGLGYGQPFQIIGITPRGFNGTDADISRAGASAIDCWFRADSCR